MSHTINVADLTDHDAVLRVLLDIQGSGISYSLVQDGIEVAQVVPVDHNDDKVSEETTRKRWEALAEMDKLSEKIAALWATDETAAEAVANNRR